MTDFQNSSLYKTYLAEVEEINKHKWIESEKAGYDIGWNKALIDWVQNHKLEYTKARKNRASDVFKDSTS